MKLNLNQKLHYVVSISFLIIVVILISLLSRPLASQSNTNKETDHSTLKNKVNDSPERTYMNLLYQFFRQDIEDREDYYLENDIVDYDGYFKRMEFQTYVIQKNDTLSHIGRKFNINIDTIISYNEIKSARSLRIGKVLIIPNINGILHMVKKSESLDKIANQYKKYNVRLDDIVFINEIERNKITPGERLFIPGAKLPTESPLRKLEFIRPVQGRIVSVVGRRRHPVYRVYKFHTGLDIKANYGSPVKAARDGRVKFAGWKGGYGKLVIINHGGGLQTYYGHLSKFYVKNGMHVKKRRVIGRVGSTGISTGSHLHFEVRKYNKVQRILKRYTGLVGKRGAYFIGNN